MRIWKLANNNETLELGKRASLGNSDDVTYFGSVFFVMRVELCGDLVALLVLRVGLVSIDRDDDGFIHLRARDGSGLGSHANTKLKVEI